jgi:AcrR family transcriptional regulator
MPPVSQRYRDARRRQITGAARRCFARAGFHGTSMQDVFVESGLSAGAVYGYFDSKDALVSTIIDEVLAEITGALDAIIDSASPPPPGNVLGQMFQALDGAPHGTEIARGRSETGIERPAGRPLSPAARALHHARAALPTRRHPRPQLRPPPPRAGSHCAGPSVPVPTRPSRRGQRRDLHPRTVRSACRAT